MAMVVLFCKHAGNNSILQTGAAAAAAAAKSLQSEEAFRSGKGDTHRSNTRNMKLEDS